MLYRDTLPITNFCLMLDCRNDKFHLPSQEQKTFTPNFYNIFLIAGYLALYLRSSVKLYLALLSWGTL